MHHSDELAGEIALARRFALRGLELDPIDPFVNFTMGRTFWLEGDLESSLAWLERATSISPNYAQGIYARAWTESLAGRGLNGRRHVDLAMRLSPLDPLYYAMLATRAFTHIVMGGQCALAQSGPHPVRFLPCVSDDVRGNEVSHAERPRALPVLSAEARVPGA